MVINQEYLEFLEEVRSQGIVHMYGLAPYLKEAFNLSIEEAQECQAYYLENYCEIAENFGWEETRTPESPLSRLARLKDARENYKYYERILAAAETEPGWFSIYTLTDEFKGLEEEKARELLRKFITNFDIVTTLYYNPASIKQENEEAGIEE